MIGFIYLNTRNVLRKFILSGPLQDTNTVTIKDLNYVIRAVNNLIYYRPIDFMLTANGQSNPVYKLLVEGDTECQGSCNCSTNECGCSGSTSDPGACEKSAFPILNPTPSRFAVGVYHLTFAANHPALVNNRGVAVWPAALSNIAHRITVSKMVNNVITISTYDSGVLSDSVLDQTVFAVKLYTK